VLRALRIKMRDGFGVSVYGEGSLRCSSNEDGD